MPRSREYLLLKSNVGQHVGQIDYFKVVSGTVREGDDLVNTSQNGSRERLSNLHSSGSKPYQDHRATSRRYRSKE